MSKEAYRVPIRSYRLVTDKLERRIFKVDRYRLPMPYGVPLRSVLYFAGAVVGVGIAGALPILGSLLGVVPPSIRWVALPGLIAFALTHFEIDGRPPHVALVGWARYAARPKHLAGLRPCPPVGTMLAPVHEIIVAPSGEETTYRPGRVAGPATVRFRYPAEVVPEGLGRGARGLDAPGQLAAAKRLRIRGVDARGPLVVGTEISVPAEREVVFGE